MKVKELIEQLQKLDQESIVVMPRGHNGGGEGYSPFSDVDAVYYEEETSYLGYVTSLQHEDDYDAEDWEDIINKSQSAVALYHI